MVDIDHHLTNHIVNQYDRRGSPENAIWIERKSPAGGSLRRGRFLEKCASRGLFAVGGFLVQIFARIGIGAVRFAFHPGQRIVADRRVRILSEFGFAFLVGSLGRQDRFLRLLPLGAQGGIAA